MSPDSPVHPDISFGMQHYLNGHREVLCAGHLAHQLRQTSTRATQTSTMLSDGIQQWILVRRYAVSAHYVSLYHDIPRWESSSWEAKSYSAVNVDLQQSLCLTIEYCQRVIFLCAWERVAVYIPFHHLRISLTRLLRSMTDAACLEHGEALLFLFFVGAVGEELALVDSGNTTTTTAATPAGLSDRWFSKHMATVAVKLGSVEFDATKALLSRFLYDAVALDQTLEALIAKTDEFLQEAPD